jgi:hypothetical protein
MLSIPPPCRFIGDGDINTRRKHSRAELTEPTGAPTGLSVGVGAYDRGIRARVTRDFLSRLMFFKLLEQRSDRLVLISSSFLRHYDETKTLPYSLTQFCLTGADGAQLCLIFT